MSSSSPYDSESVRALIKGHQPLRCTRDQVERAQIIPQRGNPRLVRQHLARGLGEVRVTRAEGQVAIGVDEDRVEVLPANLVGERQEKLNEAVITNR